MSRLSVHDARRPQIAIRSRLCAHLVLLLSSLSILSWFETNLASAAWEMPGAKCEVFDLDGCRMTEVPDGFSSCVDVAGGMFVVAFDASAEPRKIRVSRLAHDGTELWGQGGIGVPRDISSLGQHCPVAVAPDGAGGAYVGYVETWSTYQLFRLAHLTPSGSVDRITSVDNAGNPGDYERLGIQLVPVANGDVLAVWTQRTAPPKLHAARFTAAGAMPWHVDVNQGYSHREFVVTNTRTSWQATSDMLDGLLITWLRLNVGTPEIGAQRIGPDGLVWWGTDGHRIWSGYSLDFHDPVIVGDVIGGAFVVMSHLGIATAQHLDPWGTEQWPAGGILVQDSATPYYAQSTEPAVCYDGAFGFVMVHGNEDLYAQRVDYWGNRLWGAGVGVGNRAGQQNHASVAPDGAQGVVVVWQDEYYGIPGQPWHVLAGMRLDANGVAAWGPSDLYSSWSVYDPHDPQLVLDGSGGGLCAWANFDLDDGWDDVWAMAVGGGATSVEEPGTRIAVAGLRALPNPCRGVTRLEARIPDGLTAALRIYDLSGRLVRSFAALPADGGPVSFRWDGRDDEGRTVGQGVYMARLGSAPEAAACPVVVVR